MAAGISENREAGSRKPRVQPGHTRGGVWKLSVKLGPPPRKSLWRSCPGQTLSLPAHAPLSPIIVTSSWAPMEVQVPTCDVPFLGFRVRIFLVCCFLLSVAGHRMQRPLCICHCSVCDETSETAEFRDIQGHRAGAPWATTQDACGSPCSLSPRILPSSQARHFVKERVFSLLCSRSKVDEMIHHWNHHRGTEDKQIPGPFTCDALQT